MKKIRIGIIGAGWMGAAHATAYSRIKQCYNDIEAELACIVDTNEEQAIAAYERFGFQRWSTDPEDIISDPNIHVVDITTPNQFHVNLVIRAAKTGKAIFCEKPLGMNGTEAKKAYEAVKNYNNISMCGFVYINNPAIVQARKLISSGELGELIAFHGQYDMEYRADPTLPHAWRDSDEISGALGDIGAHMLAISNYVVGSKIDEVCGKSKTVYEKRTDPENPDNMCPVTNDDVFNLIYTYENGALGNIVTSRVAPGNKVGIRFEVQLTNGAVRFDQERMNELEVYYHSDASENQGFKNIKMGPVHGDFQYFSAAAGLNISYMDLITMQAHKIVRAVADGCKVTPDIKEAYEVNVLIDALLKSDKEHRWVKVAECENE